MSQAKVDARKQEKIANKNWKHARNVKRAIITVVAIVCVAAIIVGVFIVDSLKYKDVNTGKSKYDDAAVAEIVGYDYDMSQVLQ